VGVRITRIEEGFIAQRTCDGAEFLTPRTPFGMTSVFGAD
jgi:hypothetical protein